MNAPIPNDDDKPLDPATEKVRRKLARYGAVFMGLNMVALMAVLGAIVYKISNRSSDTAPVASSVNQGVPIGAGLEGAIDLPDGAKVINASQNSGQILLNLTFADGSAALWIYDINTGQIIGKLRID